MSFPETERPALACTLPGSDLWLREEGDGSFTVGLLPETARRAATVSVYRGPRSGERLLEGRPAASLETSKWVGHLASPVNGVVLESNSRLERDPGLIVRAPTSDGWLFRVRPDEPAALRDRLTPVAGPSSPRDG